MQRPSRPVVIILTLLVLVASACASGSTESDAADQAAADGSTTTTITSTPATESSTTTASNLDEAKAEGEAQPEEPEGPEPAADLVIDGTFLDGEIVIEDRRFEVERGSSVLIRFESDQTEHIHLHGYDILVDLVPGQPAELAFVADSPGSFEVELEDSRRFLFELLVR